MLQWQTLPATLAGMLLAFRWCFTEPSFRTFAALVVGMVARPGRRTVCGMLVGAGLSRLWHHSRAHWFFSHARWSAEQVGLVLVGLIVTGLIPLLNLSFSGLHLIMAILAIAAGAAIALGR